VNFGARGSPRRFWTTLVLSFSSVSKMPLNKTDQAGISDNDRMAIAFWMTVDGVRPVSPIRVFVTYPALASMEPSQLRDTHAAFDIFERRRTEIEAVASRKFDNSGADEGEYQGQPILMIGPDDLP
jgi:hypothetical protein